MTRGFQTRTNHSDFGPTLEFDNLPAVGADRHAGSGRAWQRLLIALGGFWVVAAAALIGFVL